ncbi:hypothetical protein ScPMuIL_013161 [Solemya velum]
MLYDADGVHPDPDKVKAIQEMDTPQSAKQLQEFLGMVTYLSPFLPHASQLTAPLRELFKKDVLFDWTPSHQVAYNKIISLISREVSLSYFDPQKPSVLQVDASSRGLGAVLMQANKPIAFASKSLSECEQRYANIERELLAVVFGCEKFHTYLYGKRFLVESDHKPLEMIHLKNISSAPQRLQRMLLRIQQYDLQIAYKPGKEVAMADALSRSPVSESTTIDLDVQVHLVQFSEQKQDELREATRSDSELQALNSVILAGWPERQSELPPMLRQYWSYRDELSIQNGIIVKGERVVIPTSMQSYILGKLHESHLGIEKTKMRARTCVFWRNCNSDIENMIKSCHICQKSQKKQSSEPLLQHSVPTRPWQIIGSDIFYLDGFEYIIYCDYYSKFPIVRKIHGKSTADTVVNITKQLFAEQGIPETLMSDNGPQYASYAFKKFSADWDFRHVTSSPHYPQSNAEPYATQKIWCRSNRQLSSERPDDLWHNHFVRRHENLHRGFHSVPWEPYSPVGGEIILDPCELILTTLSDQLDHKIWSYYHTVRRTDRRQSCDKSRQERVKSSNSSAALDRDNYPTAGYNHTREHIKIHYRD